MIQALIRVLSALSNLLDSCAQKEQARTEAKLKQASELVTQANAHRKAAKFARNVASSLRDIQSP